MNVTPQSDLEMEARRIGLPGRDAAMTKAGSEADVSP